MAFKKEVKSNSNIVVGGGNPELLFPKGFKYAMGDNIYTVLKRFYSDNTEFRQIISSDGTVEDVTVETIVKDLKYSGANVIEDPREDSE